MSYQELTGFFSTNMHLLWVTEGAFRLNIALSIKDSSEELNTLWLMVTKPSLCYSI